MNVFHGFVVNGEAAEVVANIAASGTTVLYTTHYLEEAEEFCHRIAIMEIIDDIHTGVILLDVERLFQRGADRIEEGLRERQPSRQPG